MQATVSNRPACNTSCGASRRQKTMMSMLDMGPRIMVTTVRCSLSLSLSEKVLVTEVACVDAQVRSRDETIDIFSNVSRQALPFKKARRDIIDLGRVGVRAVKST